MKSPLKNPHLGELEQAIMEVLWKHQSATVRTVVALLQPKRTLAYTTVMTVMNRLVEKKLLQRKQQGSSYSYAPTHDRATYFATASSQAIDSLIQSYGTVAISAFLDKLDGVDPRLIRRLKEQFNSNT